MNAVQSYLFLSADQNDRVRWSASENVLEYRDGTQTFAFAAEIAEFMEGFAGQRRLIHFGLLLHMLLLLRNFRILRGDSSSREFAACQRLWQLYADHGKSLRHAGAFCAQLCRDVPDAVQAGAVTEIIQQLRRNDTTIQWYSLGIQGAAIYAPEKPPWTLDRFETHVFQQLERFSDEEIQAWLEHGRGPVKDAADSLARDLPVSLMGRLASLLDRPRLRGTKAFIPQLSGALTLPPRRLTYQDLPLGGYSDVTNRGKVDQLLLSQFALDETEFIRRFVEHELLFYRKEDPNHSTRQELVVLLDQGVRTWGDIRLVLGAALLALGKQASQRQMSFYLATTAPSRLERSPADPSPLIDPVNVTEEQLGAIVEGSDLSANPGLALEGVLESVATCPRDVVLLTHPRNLNEPDVRAAAKRTRPDMRLFALSLDRHGAAVLHEMRHGTAVAIRQFHVDFSRAAIQDEDEKTPSPARHFGTWDGDVEPIGFPFRFGVDGKVGGFDFDLEGQYLLTSCRHGLLHLWEVGGTLAEMLPRAWYQQQPVTDVDAIVGVHGGFVVVSRNRQRFLAIHYDLQQRRCTIHPLDEHLSSGPTYSNFGYSAAHHCFIAERQKQSGDSIDLGSGDRFATKSGGNASRAQEAWQAWERNQVPRRTLIVDFSFAPFVLLSKKLPGQITVSRVEPAWEPFTPLADGKPLLAGARISEAQIGGDHLALRVISPTSHMYHSVQILHRDGAVVKGMTSAGERFRLSADGRMLARQLGNGGIQYGRVDREAGTSQTLVGGFAQRLRFMLGDREMFVFPGSRQHTHHLDWRSGTLVHSTQHSKTNDTALDTVKIGEMGTGPLSLHGDLQRWTQVWTEKTEPPLLAARDAYGQIVLLDRDERLVCMFIAFRNRLAGWMPDGTCFGPTFVTGKPAAADAMEKFGRALLEAEHTKHSR
jgi:hypothetical protein